MIEKQRQRLSDSTIKEISPALAFEKRNIFLKSMINIFKRLKDISKSKD